MTRRRSEVWGEILQAHAEFSAPVLAVSAKTGRNLPAAELLKPVLDRAVIDIIEDTELLRRLHGEFDELPHMRLTCPQAARLMDVDDEICALALQTLLALGYLVKHGPSYARADHDHCAAFGGV